MKTSSALARWFSSFCRHRDRLVGLHARSLGLWTGKNPFSSESGCLWTSSTTKFPLKNFTAASFLFILITGRTRLHESQRRHWASCLPCRLRSPLLLAPSYNWRYNKTSTVHFYRFVPRHPIHCHADVHQIKNCTSLVTRPAVLLKAHSFYLCFEAI